MQAHPEASNPLQYEETQPTPQTARIDHGAKKTSQPIKAKSPKSKDELKLNRSKEP